MIWFSVAVWAIFGCATEPQSAVSAVDVQATACGRVEECDAEGFAATYGDIEQCVNAYDDTTSVCYDLYCDYSPEAGETCQAGLEAQTCDQVTGGEEVPACKLEALFSACDQAAVDACVSNLGDTPVN